MAEYKREVKIPQKSGKELYDRVSQDIAQFLKKESMAGFSVECVEPKLQVLLKGPMVQATLSCEDGLIKLQAQLGFLALPFKAKFDEGITRWLQKTFNV